MRTRVLHSWETRRYAVTVTADTDPTGDTVEFGAVDIDAADQDPASWTAGSWNTTYDSSTKTESSIRARSAHPNRPCRPTRLSPKARPTGCTPQPQRHRRARRPRRGAESLVTCPPCTSTVAPGAHRSRCRVSAGSWTARGSAASWCITPSWQHHRRGTWPPSPPTCAACKRSGPTSATTSRIRSWSSRAVTTPTGSSARVEGSNAPVLTPPG